MYFCIHKKPLWFDNLNNIRELSSSLPRFLWTSSPENNAAMSYCAAKLFRPQPSPDHRLRAPIVRSSPSLGNNYRQCHRAAAQPGG